jgi:hypothetical protein
MEGEFATDFKDVYIWNINILVVVPIGSMNIYGLQEYNIHRGTLYFENKHTIWGPRMPHEQILLTRKQSVQRNFLIIVMKPS